MTFTPHPFQEADVKVLRDNNYTAMLNIQTGGGKTATTAFALKDSGASTVLISAPAQTMNSAWYPTITDILGVEPREIGNSTKAKKSALMDFELGYPGVYMVTPQLLARKSTDVSLWTGDAFILDEAHELMSPGKSGERRIAGYTPFESEQALCRHFDMRLALSGTSFRNRFEYAWSYGRFLWWWLDGRDDPSYENHWVWKQDRMTSKIITTAQVDERTGQKKKVTQFLSEKEPGLWISQVPCVITHLKREKCCEFHPNGFMDLEEPTVIHETIPLLPAQKKAIKELEDMAVTWLDEHPMVTEIPLTTAQRIRQVTLGVPTLIPVGDGEYEVTFSEDCESPILDWAISQLEWELEDETCVIWTDSQKFASVATNRLNKRGIRSFEYSGATRDTRDDNLTKFGSEFRVMVGVIAAGGTGLDSLQRVCNNEIWLNFSTDETDNEQARGRTDRMGQTKQVMRWYLHDDLGLSQGRFGDALARRLELNRSYRGVA